MAAKKPNFFDNVWNAIKKPVVAAVTFAGNGVGALIGIPALGTLAGGALSNIPVKTVESMAAAAAAAGVVKTAKVSETLVNNGVAPTDTNIKALSEVVNKVVVASPENPIKSSLPVDTAGLTGFGKFTHMLSQYWYLTVAGVGLIAYLLIKKLK